MTVAPMPTLDRSRNRSHRKADIDAADVARNQADLFHFERIEPGRGGAKHVFAFSQLGKSVPCVVRFRFVLIVARHVSGFDLRAGDDRALCVRNSAGKPNRYYVLLSYSAVVRWPHDKKEPVWHYD
jgi:hypothetical protein